MMNSLRTPSLLKHQKEFSHVLTGLVTYGVSGIIQDIAKGTFLRYAMLFQMLMKHSLKR